MSKTKYIKVSVAERLPEKSGTYYSEIGEVFFAQSSCKFEHNYEAHNVYPEFWLEPVPDREEEMREMLQNTVFHFQQFEKGYETIPQRQLIDKIKEFLKQPN